MIRTQIYLTPKQHTMLKNKAHKENATVSEEIRKILDKELFTAEQQVKKQNTGNWLLSMAEEAERLGANGPSDLASNVDAYLYGDKK